MWACTHVPFVSCLGALLPALRCRADLRHLAVCSVDPPGCKDIDDALHVRRLPNGNFELGVSMGT